MRKYAQSRPTMAGDNNVITIGKYNAKQKMRRPRLNKQDAMSTMNYTLVCVWAESRAAAGAGAGAGWLGESIEFGYECITLLKKTDWYQDFRSLFYN